MNLEKIIGDRDLVVLDLETTGTSTKEDWIVQFAAVRIFADGRERETVVRLVKPGIPIPEAATAVHRITDDMVEGEPTFPELCDEIELFLKDADLGGYNIFSFDLPLLRTEFERCGRRFVLSDRRIVDGMTIFKHFERRDLGSALRFYCGADHTTAHDALGDVEATIEVIQAQLERYESIPRDLTGLDKLSRGNRITPEGEIQWMDGVPCMGFGKHRGVPLPVMVAKHEGYLRWILKSDFSYEVHEVITAALKGDFPTRE